MAHQFDLRLQTSREIPAGLLTLCADLAEFYGGGYLRLGFPLVIPSIPAQALPAVRARLAHAGVNFTVLESDLFSDIFQEGAGI